jgi:hypothetical protein
MVFAFRILEPELGLQCGRLDWCYVYLEQRSEVMLLIKQFGAMGLRQYFDARIPCICSELIYATLCWHLGNKVF